MRRPGTICLALAGSRPDATIAVEDGGRRYYGKIDLASIELPMAPSIPAIPPYTWQWPIGQGWDQYYVVRYASNLDDGPWHGAPLGGFGAGCIGRSPRGDVNLWHLDGGEHVFASFPGCQFSVFEQGQDHTQAYALSTVGPTDGTLSQWQWYPGGGTYHALYPRSWYVYEGVFQAALSCEQFSPIWAHNYRESSYPVAVFCWRAHNPTARPLTLSIMLSWQNMVGWFTNGSKSPQVQLRDDGSPFYDYEPRLGQSQGNYNRWVQQGTWQGCLMDGAWSVRRATPMEGDGQWAIATAAAPGTDIFHHSRWQPQGDGADLWQSFSRDGSLANVDDPTPAAAAEQLGSAIASRFTLAPGETRQIPFVLSWDLPVTEFAAGLSAYRRYTDFFGRDGQQAWAIATTALSHYPHWQQQIIAWQQPILAQPQLPDWLKMALFNELYDLSSGGSLWSAASPADPVGQFAVLECFDYCWYESLDVRLYGGLATLLLWPELEKAVLRAFARAIPQADNRHRVIGYYSTIGVESPQAIRKAAGATPHDLGAPNEQPWEQTNYTSYQDCNQWKDLPSDFVIQVYRAYRLTGETDLDFLATCWPAVTATLAYLKGFDQDGDGLPENGGAPDQTFDDWQLKGVSAYCGGLWMAALTCAIAMAEVLIAAGRAPASAPQHQQQYRHWLAQSRQVYPQQLWNGHYYRLDSGSGSQVVMADQLCGQVWVRLLGLPDLLPAAQVQSALDAIYDACFLKFNAYAARQAQPQTQKFAGAQVGNFRSGQLGVPIGAANGVLPDGCPEDPDSTHPLEVWTGINFGLATGFAQLGRVEQALELAAAVVHQIYTYGLQFRTPEAITALGTFRACHYLRPLAIWGLYGVLCQWQSQLDSQS